MAKVEYQNVCALCGQPVEIEGFTLNTPHGLLKFCCAGCLSIYQLLNEDDSTPSLNDTSERKEDSLK